MKAAQREITRLARGKLSPSSVSFCAKKDFIRVYLSRPHRYAKRCGLGSPFAVSLSAFIIVHLRLRVWLRVRLRSYSGSVEHDIIFVDQLAFEIGHDPG
jgi:hypothetical protein